MDRDRRALRISWRLHLLVGISQKIALFHSLSPDRNVVFVESAGWRADEGYLTAPCPRATIGWAQVAIADIESEKPASIAAVPLGAHPPMRIILIRHGRPNIPTSPRTSHHEFRSYIDAYEAAGLDPESMPPEELQDLLCEIDAVYTSERKRSVDSARALAPHAELIADPLFAEAPIASPPIPLLRMKVPKWAVVGRILWHAGYHPEIENYRKAKHRAAQAADILIKGAHKERAAALVAHGYFNFLIGRELRRRGFKRSGSHRAHFWNSVVYAMG